VEEDVAAAVAVVVVVVVVVVVRARAHAHGGGYDKDSAKDAGATVSTTTMKILMPIRDHHSQFQSILLHHDYVHGSRFHLLKTTPKE
jgi:hypothetical protein